MSDELNSANRRAEYWKAEHNAANDEIERLRADLAASQAECERLRADFSALQSAIVGDTGASAILTVEQLRRMAEDAARAGKGE